MPTSKSHPDGNKGGNGGGIGGTNQPNNFVSRGIRPSTNLPFPSFPLLRPMKFKCTFSETISDVFKHRGWIEADDRSDDWDIYFCDMIQIREFCNPNSPPLKETQRIGHFRNNFQISRKNFMVQNLKRLKRRLERAFGRDEGKKCQFFPTTYVLPEEEEDFLAEIEPKSPCFWIIKPAAGAQGRGIFIIKSVDEYYEWRHKFDANRRDQPPTLSQHDPLDYKQYVLNRLKISSSGSQNSTVNTEMLSAYSPEADNHPQVEIREEPTVVLNPSEENLMNPTTENCYLTSVPSTDNLMLPMNASGDPSKPEIIKNEIYVIQQYITNPYLIDGKKFDIRFFVLVTSFLPLRAWMYREGFARFSQKQFSLKSLQDVFVHLTNVAIQRTAKDYDPEKGTKWSIRKLRQHFESRHGYALVQRMMNQIDNIVIRTLQSVHRLILQDRHCFEIYGFDVLIDDALKPWLLEVNCSPSFTPSNDEDYILKSGIVEDTITVLDLESRLTGYERRIGGYDMIWDDGPVYSTPGYFGYDGQKLNSFLGCSNDRINQLRTIYTNAQLVRNRFRLSQAAMMSYRDPPRSPRGNSKPSTARHREISNESSLIVVGKALELKRNSTAVSPRNNLGKTGIRI